MELDHHYASWQIWFGMKNLYEERNICMISWYILTYNILIISFFKVNRYHLKGMIKT